MLLGIRWGSLRRKIIVWSFVPTLIILSAVALVTFVAYQQGTEELVIQRDQQLVRLSAGQLSAEFMEYADLLDSLARSAAIYGGDSEVRQAELEEPRNRLVIFDAGIVLLDTRGRVAAAYPRRPEIIGEDWSDRHYFQEMVRFPQPVFSNIVADGPEGADVVLVAVPIIGARGEFRGALAGMFRLGATAISAFYGDIVKQRIAESNRVYLVDDRGRVIYHSQINRIGTYFTGQPVVQRVTSGQADAVRTRDVADREIVAAFAPVPETPWGLVAETSWDALTASSQRYQRFLIMLMALGVVLPAAVAAVGVRRITGPIRDLIDAAQEVAHGEFGRTITAQTGDEIEELATQFNAMSAQLQASYANLERRVADRTRELAALNAVAAVVSGSLDLEQTLSGALDKALEVLEFESGAIYLRDLRTGKLKLARHRGLSDEFRRVLIEIDNLSPRVAATGEPIITDDIARDPGAAPAVVAEGYRSVASIPLVSKDQVHGVLTIGSRQMRPFHEQNVNLLLSVGRQIGVAIENARLFGERTRRVDELSVLNKVGQTISSTLQLGELLDLIHRQVGRVMDVTNLYIAIYHSDEERLSFPLYVEGDRVRRDIGGREMGQGLTEYVIRTRQPLLLSDHVADRMRELGIEAIGQAAESWLGVPMIAGERILGVMAVQSYAAPNTYDAEHLKLLSTVAQQAAIALENARLFDMVQERRIDEQAALLIMSNQLLGRLDLSDMMEYLVEEVRTLLHADACALLLRDEEPGYLAVDAASGWRHDPVAASRRVPADERSGSGLTMHTRRPIVVRDIAEADDTLWLPDWVQAEGFRGLAIVPLIADGHAIGALVLTSRRPRLVDDDELRFLRLMANQAAIAIEKARLHEEEIRQQQMMQELRVAQHIQQTFLPKEAPTLPGWHVAAFYRPARAVGGDFYDFITLPDDQVVIVVGDVADKGVPAALLMATTRAVLRAAAQRQESPGQVLARVNALLHPDMAMSMFVTCLFAILEPATGRLRYASAGQNPPYHRTANGVVELPSAGLPLGVLPDTTYQEREVVVATGDSLLFSSDGVVEAHAPDGRMYGFPRLQAFLAGCADGTTVIECLLDELAGFTGPAWEQEDDITLVSLQRVG